MKKSKLKLNKKTIADLSNTQTFKILGGGTVGTCVTQQVQSCQNICEGGQTIAEQSVCVCVHTDNCNTSQLLHTCSPTCTGESEQPVQTC